MKEITMADVKGKVVQSKRHENEGRWQKANGVRKED